MLVSDLLSPERVLPLVRTSSKKRLLELVSEALVQNDETLDSREIFESLCARERLGSTGSSEVQAVFIRLAKPLAFDAVDGKPVDLLFALAVPERCTSDHLKLLSQIAERFSDTELLEKLRTAEDSNELIQLLSNTHH